MRPDLRRRAQSQQRVQHATVTNVYLGGLHQSFAGVFKPRRQASHQECAGENVHIAAGGLLIQRYRAAQFRGVERAAVQMREHRPEPPQPLGWQGNAKPRRITAEESLDEILTPRVTRGVIVCQERARKAAAFPEPCRMLSAPVSVTSKPPSCTNATRPASDSDAPRIKSGEALPRSRKRAGVPGRSDSTRNTGRSCGMV